jgi:hypothetical protein
MKLIYDGWMYLPAYNTIGKYYIRNVEKKFTKILCNYLKDKK